MQEPKPFTNLTEKEALDLHKTMWDWIAKQTYARRKCMTKQDYANEADNAMKEIFMQCPACHYSVQHAGAIQCRECILLWDEFYPQSTCSAVRNDDRIPITEGLFTRWTRAVSRNDYRTAADLAQEIADLPAKTHALETRKENDTLC